MPTEIALLADGRKRVQSECDVGGARAPGMWQFMPSTGRHFGLKQNWWFDSRRDVLAATTRRSITCRSCTTSSATGSWRSRRTTGARATCGRAVARNKAKGLPTDYASLTGMPAETQNYVPKLQAVKNIVTRAARDTACRSADIPDAPYFTVVKTTLKMDVKRAAELAELPLDEFLALNPQHNRPVIAGADEYAILLPIDNAEMFAAKLELIDQPLVSWQAYRVKPNESLPQIAAKYGMSAETLLAINGIGPRTRVPPGHTLLVPSQRASAESADSLSKAVFTSVPSGRTLYYTVRRGDTLPVIAARYGVTAQDVRHWNNLMQNKLDVGQRIKIVSDAGPVQKRQAKARRQGPAKAASGKSARR